MSNWKRNPNLVIGLCVALGLAVLVIAYFAFRSQSSTGEEVKEAIEERRNPPTEAPRRPPPPSRIPPFPGGAPPGGPKPALVFFHSNSCGHCTHMMPDWQKAEGILKQMGICEPISLNDQRDAEEVHKHGISGWPTIRYYPDGFPGRFVEYRGNRSAESLVKFAQSGGQAV